MATTTETEEAQGEEVVKKEDLVQVWIYVQDFAAPHPIYDKTQIRARAVNQFGREIGELYADTIEGIKEQGCALHEPGTRVSFVDNPDAHPLLSKILGREKAQSAASAAQEDLSTPSSRRDRAPMEAMRREHHLCDACACRDVCTLATLPMAEEQLVTIASCLAFAPADSTDEKNPDG